ncbi:hypothetical protein WJX72_004894 [[Myrmecia] bisecta]|uniref:Ammonium transporter AmtB-like domain-containing protein n=1 Tax=[Myrmecia] bisecta TaxID=41462 RepID=A0AAW1QQA5_9CHLO
MDEVLLPLTGHRKTMEWNLRGAFAAPLAPIIVVLLGLFAVFTKYNDSNATDAHVQRYYVFYTHVSIMVFVGFGFLMTFLRRYSYSAVGLNFFTSCLVMLEAILVVGAVQQVVWGSAAAGKIEVDLPLLIDAGFCAAAAMISFGAVLGKLSPTQLTFLLLLEVPLYAINQHLVFDTFKALDIGGSMSIHAFGAYYGLAASLVLCGPGSGSSHLKNGASYTSDMTAMIGTIFLWIFWPSFNGALASNPAAVATGGVQFQFHCIINTIIALLGACVSTFAASAAYDGKFNMVHIQNATLAGGVAIGSAANMKILPGGALLVGVLAGVLSTTGYKYIAPTLEAKIALRDTCGVHNLHGMPGVLGGLAAAAASALAFSANEPILRHGKQQWLYQLLALAVTLAIALVGGALAGTLVRLCSPARHTLGPELMYEDGVFWEEVEAEEGEDWHGGAATNGTNGISM